MATDASSGYRSPKHIYLDLLEGSRAKQRYFLKIAPSLIECWSQIEQTPTTKEMLRILKRANSIITNKLKHDEAIEECRISTSQDEVKTSL